MSRQRTERVLARLVLLQAITATAFHYVNEILVSLFEESAHGFQVSLLLWGERVTLRLACSSRLDSSLDSELLYQLLKTSSKGPATSSTHVLAECLEKIS